MIYRDEEVYWNVCTKMGHSFGDSSNNADIFCSRCGQGLLSLYKATNTAERG